MKNGLFWGVFLLVCLTEKNNFLWAEPDLPFFLLSLTFVDWLLKWSVIHPAFQKDHEVVPGLEMQ